MEGSHLLSSMKLQGYINCRQTERSKNSVCYGWQWKIEKDLYWYNKLQDYINSDTSKLAKDYKFIKKIEVQNLPYFSVAIAYSNLSLELEKVFPQLEFKIF